MSLAVVIVLVDTCNKGNGIKLKLVVGFFVLFFYLLFSCQIDWKKGKNVTLKTIKKKQKHKGRGTVRTVTKTVSNDSFFNFFSPPEGKLITSLCVLTLNVDYISLTCFFCFFLQFLKVEIW